MIGVLIPIAVYAYVLLLHLVLPARHVRGYVTHDATGEKLSYRLNGLLVLLAVVASGAGLVRFDVVSAELLWTHRWVALVGACLIGLVFTAGVVLTSPSTGKSLVADLFLGRQKNPQFIGNRVDAKMYLYLVGAVMLELNVLSFAAHARRINGGALPTSVTFYAAMFSFFVSEYLFFEEVHLYTYDFVAERVGFKLGWGCFTFYPFFYCVGLWSVAQKPNPHVSTWLLAFSAAVFITGWLLSRGANLQKFFFKTRPERSFLGMAQQTVTDGTYTLLCSGFWKVSRHVNYLGEICMATGTLALGQLTNPFPWLYPLYYVALLLPRERDDDKRCAQKYGPLWDEYKRRVPSRIVPYVY
jgi:protein-S-isoprenylcysteine O-methyltransferase Ste14